MPDDTDFYLLLVTPAEFDLLIIPFTALLYGRGEGVTAPQVVARAELNIKLNYQRIHQTEHLTPVGKVAMSGLVRNLSVFFAQEEPPT